MALHERLLCKELALQDNVVQARAGQDLQEQAKIYIHCSFTEEVDSLKYWKLISLLYPKCLPTVCHGTRRIHDA